MRVGLIGAGKFGAMYLAQARRTLGVHVVAICDLNVQRARSVCERTEWPSEQYAASSLNEAMSNGSTLITDDVAAVVRSGYIEVLVDATGDAAAGIRHCLLAIEHGAHIIMVNVEADALAGPLLAKRARAAGLIYSLAYGDQPAIICEQVDWARTAGFEVICAGKGTRYHPEFHRSTPETVWKNFDFTEEAVERGGMNPKMHNSFIDGTKSAIEMSAVCNATGLVPQEGGLGFPPASRFELADVCKPAADGGTLTRSGTTEVVSSLTRDRTPVPHHLQMGTYVVVRANNKFVRDCFKDYRLLQDKSSEYAAMYRPTHLIGLELGVSVASVALRHEPTGAPIGFVSDAVAVAKSDLSEGTVLDGEGGYCVWGKQTPAAQSLALGAVPIGLAHGVKLRKPVKAGSAVSWSDVELDPADEVVKTRREMESLFTNRS